LLNQGYVSEIFVSFQGEGARVGERHLFVRMAACNLRCRYCDTPDSLEKTAYLTIHCPGRPPERIPNPVMPADLLDRAQSLLAEASDVDAVAITGGEPLLQANFLADFLREARFEVPILLETNGTLPKQLATLLPWIQVISMDIKPPSNTGERAFWSEHEEFLGVAAERETDVYVKVLVDQSTSDDEIARAGALVARHGNLPVFLQPIMAPSGRVEIDHPTLSRLFGVARRFHSNVRVLPQTHKILGIP
jgi:7-carboxy-7-deazaguanine synthase